jgi:hypothetical protein
MGASPGGQAGVPQVALAISSTAAPDTASRYCGRRTSAGKAGERWRAQRAGWAARSVVAVDVAALASVATFWAGQPAVALLRAAGLELIAGG